MIDWDKVVVGPTTGVFGEPVHYMPAAAAPFDIVGVYDDAYVEVDPAGSMGVTSARPVLGVQLSAFPSPPLQSDRLTIVRTGEAFFVKEVRPDGHGAAKLMLSLDSDD
jgi:hypothetical protein